MKNTALKSISSRGCPKAGSSGRNSRATHAAPLHGLARRQSEAAGNSQPKLCAARSPKSPVFEPIRYWILWRNDDAIARIAYGIPPRTEPEFPHEGLCASGFASPGELMADLQGKGWTTGAFDNTPNRFALVETSESGLTVKAFPTYAAAVAAHQELQSSDEAQQSR